MNPGEQKTSVVIERIYSQFTHLKAEESTTSYSGCFEAAFETKYDNAYCHLIQQRKGVINNIPYILGAFGHVCNSLGLPPLCCLVVNKETCQCSEGVITSKEVPDAERPEFAEKVDRPATYACNDYPQPGTQKAQDFLNLVLQHLREKGMVIE